MKTNNWFQKEDIRIIWVKIPKRGIITFEKSIKQKLIWVIHVFASTHRDKRIRLIAIKLVLLNWKERKEALVLTELLPSLRNDQHLRCYRSALRFLDYEMQNSNECKRNFVACDSSVDLKAQVLCIYSEQTCDAHGAGSSACRLTGSS